MAQRAGLTGSPTRDRKAAYDAQRGLLDMGAVLDERLARLPRKGALLDLGCGAGEPLALAFVERGEAVIGSVSRRLGGETSPWVTATHPMIVSAD